MHLSIHPHLEKHGSFEHLKLGRKPFRRDPRALKLADYLDLSAISYPATFDNTSKVASWPMYGNDTLGDCTCAAVGHMIQAWTAAVGTTKTLPDSAITDLYWNTGDGQDDGRECVEILKAWQKPGVDGDVNVAYVSINPTNHAEIMAGMYLFGGVYIGVDLPITAQTQKVWDVVGNGKTGNSAPGSWGGHCVPYEGYTSSGITFVTWGGLMEMTWEFNDVYTEEIYAVLDIDWLDSNGVSLAGFNLAQLQADLAQIHSGPNPIPDPGPTGPSGPSGATGPSGPVQTNAQLRDAAVAELQKTTVGYKNNSWKTPPKNSAWKKGLDILGQIS